jgi:putative ABC transport system permease protein
MPTLLQDFRFGGRLLLRNPGHSLAAVLALALGIGLATAMFSIVYGAMMRGLPVPEAERILHIENANPSRDQPSLEIFLHDFLDIRDRQKSYEHLAGYYEGTLNLSGDGGQPERFNGLFVSANGFDLLKVQPELGRGFLRGEDSPQAEPVAVISHGVWRSRYQGDPKVLGKAVRINGQPGTIVGVMPQGFAFPEETEVWTPLRLDPMRTERGQGETLEVMGRLGDGVTFEAARAEMVSLAKALAAAHPKTNAGREAVVKPWMEEALGEETARLLWTMLAACLFVLLIACTNVASLMAARASRRTREIAIRSSLGANRRTIVSQLLTETLLLSVLGAALGVVLAYWGVKVFNAAIAGTNPPFWIRIAVDAPSLIFTLGVTLLATVFAGLLPALQASRTDVGEVLKDEGRGSSSLRLGRLSRVVVIGEVAFSCVLLIAAGLMVRSVVEVRNLDLGFDPANLFTARIALFESVYPKEADRVRFFQDLIQRLEAQPAVASVAATTNLPGGGSGLWEYRVEGRVYPEERDKPQARLAMVSPEFFNVYGAKALAGRSFGAEDNAGSLPVAVVNKTFATKVWPGEDPIGKRIRLEEEAGETNPPWRTVVGVVPDLQMAGIGPEQESPEGFYLPLAQRCPGFVSLVARSRAGNPLALTSVVRQQIAVLDRDLPIYFVFSMEEILARSRFFPNLFGVLFAIFGVAALVLASVGIYGVIAFSVDQRTQEIGIRMALGAERRNVLRMILRQGMRQLLFGLGAGLLAAVFFSKLLASFLIGVQPRDPATFTLVSLVLATVAFIACWIPAQRAMRTDPLVAIRYE